MELYTFEDRMATQEETDAIVNLLEACDKSEYRPETLAFHCIGKYIGPDEAWFLVGVSPMEELYGATRFKDGDEEKYLIVSDSPFFHGPVGQLLDKQQLATFARSCDQEVENVLESWGIDLYDRKSPKPDEDKPGPKYWDRCWNPVIGCSPASPACDHCYAARWACRFGKSFRPHEVPNRLPSKGVVFCGNMTDLFGNFITSPEAYVQHVGERSMDPRNTATYLWLTKRPGRMTSVMSESGLSASEGIASSSYFGFTAENQEWFDIRHSVFRTFPRHLKWWISAEPLLGPIDFHFFVRDEVTGETCINGLNVPQLVVVGCESGPGRRPCKLEWVEDIVDQCRKAGTMCFVKQLDIDGKYETDINKFPEHLRVRQLPWKLNKKHATKK